MNLKNPLDRHTGLTAGQFILSLSKGQCDDLIRACLNIVLLFSYLKKPDELKNATH